MPSPRPRRKLRRGPGGWGPVRLAQRQRRQPVAMGGQRRHAPRTPPSIRTRGRHHLAATQGTPAPQFRPVQSEGGTPAFDRQHARGSSGSVGQALHDLGVTDPAMLTRAAMIGQAAAARDTGGDDSGRCSLPAAVSLPLRRRPARRRTHLGDHESLGCLRPLGDQREGHQPRGGAPEESGGPGNGCCNCRRRASVAARRLRWAGLVL